MNTVQSGRAVSGSAVSKPRGKAPRRAEGLVRRQDLATNVAANIPDGELTPNVQSAVQVLMAEVDRLKQELVHSQQMVEELEYIADEDPLVKVLNRRAFDRELTRALAYAQRYGMMASFIYIDLNNFKQVNDKFGHAAGDAVLKFVGEILTENVRSSDIVGRLGGDEFGVILVHADGVVADMKMEDLVAKISAKPVIFEGTDIIVSISAGSAMFEAEDDAGSLVMRADKAMYDTKNGLKAS